MTPGPFLHILKKVSLKSTVLLLLLLFGAFMGMALPHDAQAARASLPEFPPCAPVSDNSGDQRDGVGQLIPNAQAPRLDFCAEWNPEFAFNGHRCCSKVQRSKGRRRKRIGSKVCTMDRFKPNFCDELTPEQHAFIKNVEGGKIKDVLSVIIQEMGKRGDQAFCTVNNGFLAWGRPIVPTAQNRIVLRAPDRCTQFATDHMAGLIEWTGRQVAQEYSDPKYAGVRFLIGDIAAPRGGCLAGRSGPKGHASHTTGQDADFGFLSVRPGRESPNAFITDFDAKANWWLIKNIFKNPFACVKVIFLDKRHIRKLGKAVRGDEDWDKYKRFIRHMPSHRNHLHIRVGDGPGLPGCVADARPEDELEEDFDGMEGIEEPMDLIELAPPVEPANNVPL